MRLKEFEIRSYKSCKRSKLQLDSNLTTLIGPNGVGKTNLLKAILMLKKMVVRSRFHYEQDASTVNKLKLNLKLQDNERSISLNCRIDYETDQNNLDEVRGASLEFKFDDSDWISMPRIYEILENEVIVADKKRSGKRLRFKRQKISDLMPEEDFKSIRVIIGYFEDINYYSATQYSAPSRCPASIEFEGGDTYARHPRRETFSFRNSKHKKFLADLYSSWKSKSKSYSRFINVVGSGGLRLIDGCDFKEIAVPSDIYEVKSGGKVVKRRKDKLLVIPRITQGSLELSPNQLSEGTFKTLAMLFYLITDNSSIILLEEPEVCVHHGLLNSVIDVIKSESSRKQIVMSTHSDYVLDRLSPDNLTIVEKDDTKGTLASNVGKRMTKRENVALHRYLNEVGNLGEYWREGGFDA